MKRKLNEDDVPTEIRQGQEEQNQAGFAELGLEPRLLQAIVRQNFSRPTLVQSKAIPLALEGKDILARAKTGSGKTAAYVLPILQAILKRKSTSPQLNIISALVLVPTRELAEQVTKAVALFALFCAKDIRAVNLTHKVSDAVQRSLLAETPDIVVATPARAAQNLKNAALSLNNLAHLVVDEADLVLSYGYNEDLQVLAKAIPKGVQTFLMSATLTPEVDEVKGLFCRNPVILRLEEDEDPERIKQYVVRCAEDEKFLLTYVIFKLKLIKGKCLVFVADIDRCYRLKLFLEQFGTKSCVLNSELPLNSRTHVVEEFNKGIYDIIIATDENEVTDSEAEPDKDQAKDHPKGQRGTDGEKDAEAEKNPQKKRDGEAGREETGPIEPPSKKRRAQTKKKDKEYNISRGIDFQNVSCVLNFDLPRSSRSYTHRIGRTARAGKSGMALSFVIPSELYRKHKPTSTPASKNDEAVLAKITSSQTSKGHRLEPYEFDMKQLDAFRYRMSDALRAVTRTAVREARTREIRQELLKSEKLKRHFEENPEDLRQLVRHDGELRVARVQPHLKHVPEYLLPKGARRGTASGAATGEGGVDVGFVAFSKAEGGNRIKKARLKKRFGARGNGRAAGGGTRKRDPLKTFTVGPRK